MEVSLAVAMALILAAVISYELKISSAVLEILAGMGLALVIVDISHTEWLEFLANLGMLALMFVAGFELRVRELRQNWVSSTCIGFSSFIIPFAGIYALCNLWLGLSFLQSALIGIGLSTTSLALVYHLLKEQDLLKTNDGQVMFSSASVVDVISMVTLAILLGEVGLGTFIFAVIFVFCLLALPRFGLWMFKRYPGSLAQPELRFLMVVIVGMGSMAENIGHIHPSLVAFMVGVVMARIVEDNKAVKAKLMGMVLGFFAPIFFLYSGTRIDLSSLDMEYIMVAAVMFVTATSLKFLGTYLPARKFIKDYASFSGILFNYRLSFGIITATVGLETGIISEQLFSVIMLVVVSSAAIPGFLLRAENAEAAYMKDDEVDAENATGEVVLKDD